MADDSEREKIDPVFATGMLVAGDQLGLVMVFSRPIFSPAPENKLDAHMVTSAAIIASWSLVEQMHSILTQVLDQRAQAIADAAKPPH